MGQRIIGLDLGSYALKAVELDSTFRGFQLVDVKERRVVASSGEGEETNGDHEAIKAWLKEETVSPEAIFCALPGDAVMVRFLTLPFKDRKRIDEVIGFELQDHLPFEIDDVVYDYQIVGQSDDSSRILAVAVPQHRLRSYLDTLKEGGVDPKIVGFGAWSYQHLISHVIHDEDERVAFVDVGHRRTDICVFHGGQIEFLRTTNHAGAHLDEVIARRLDVDVHEADLRKRRAGRLPDTSLGADTAQFTGLSHTADMDEVLKAALVEGVDDIVRDIRLALLSHEAEYDCGVSRLVLTGGTARLEGLSAYIESKLRLPVAPLDPTALDFNRMEDRAEGSAVLAKGLALGLQGVGSGANSLIVNLRRGPFAYEGEFRFLRERLTAMLLMVLAVLSIAGFRACSRFESLESQNQGKISELEDLSEKLLGERMQDPDKVLALVKKGTGEVDSPFPEVEAHNIFVDITSVQDEVNKKKREDTEPASDDEKDAEEDDKKDATEDEKKKDDEKPAEKDSDPPPTDRYVIELESIDIREDRGTLKGHANDIEAAELFLQGLKKHECLRHVIAQDDDIISFKRHKGWRQFQIKFDVDCAARKKAMEKEKTKEAAKEAEAKSAEEKTETSDKSDGKEE